MHVCALFSYYYNANLSFIPLPKKISTMFKFNFDGEHENTNKDKIETSEETKLKWVTASEIKSTPEQLNFLYNDEKVNTLVCGIMKIQYISPDLDCVNDASIKEAESLHSDLIPAKYEGGFKIWECTQDLANYMVNEVSHLFSRGKIVLDLGCGAGILGIIALLHECLVYFQDYNSSVINSFTIPNTLINVNKEEREIKIQSCRFFSGDWSSFLDLVRTDDTYDIIVTSETVYNPINYSKLLAIFKEKLKKSGYVFIAAKVCYFGVGGSLHEFENYVKEEGSFFCKRCWISKDGIKREILQLRHEES